MLRGGIQRTTGIQSLIRASSIIAIKGKDFIVRNFALLTASPPLRAIWTKSSGLWISYQSKQVSPIGFTSIAVKLSAIAS